MAIQIDGAGTITGLDADGISAQPVFPGQVLQVVQGQFNEFFSTSSTSFVDVTGFSASITPSNASNKILILVSTSFFAATNAAISSEIRLTVNGNAFGGTANDARMWNSNWNAATGGQAQVCETKYLYSPSSTAEQTFQVQLRTRNNATAIGRDWNADNSGMHTIILMEIAG